MDYCSITWRRQKRKRKKKSKIFFYSNQFSYTHKISNILKFCICQGLIHEIKISKIFILWSKLRQKTFFHTQVVIIFDKKAFVFHPLEDFHIINIHIDAQFLLLQKDFVLFRRRFGKVFFVFMTKSCSHFHIEKNIYKKNVSSAFWYDLKVNFTIWVM